MLSLIQPLDGPGMSFFLVTLARRMRRHAVTISSWKTTNISFSTRLFVLSQCFTLNEDTDNYSFFFFPEKTDLTSISITFYSIFQHAQNASTKTIKVGKNAVPTTAYPGWSPRGNQRWTALFHSFDVFQRWFREHDKHQRWSALIFSESALFRTEKVSAVSELNSAVSEIYSESALIFTHIDETIKIW